MRHQKRWKKGIETPSASWGMILLVKNQAGETCREVNMWKRAEETEERGKPHVPKAWTLPHAIKVSTF